jgi:hypothetical protein
MFWIDVVDSADISVQNNVTDRIITSNVTNYFESGNTNFLVDPAARDLFPNLANPTDLHDLLASGSGYAVPGSAPVSPVSSAVGSAIGDMLARAGSSSVGHTAFTDAHATSPTLDLSGLKASLVSAEPVAQAPVHAVHQPIPGPSLHDLIAHMFTDHFVALP